MILKRKLVPIAILAGIFILLTLLGAGPIGRRFIEFVRWTEARGIHGYLFFLALCVLFLLPAGPEWILAFSAGTVFGLWRGTILSAAGVTLGSSAAFLAGRYLARDLVGRKISKYPRLCRLDRALNKNSFLVVFLSRLSPAFPYSIMNYVFSLSAIPLRKFVPATLTGSLPLIFFYAYLGNLVGSGLGALESEPLLPRLGSFFLPGLAITAVVVWLMARGVHKTLGRLIDESCREEAAAGALGDET